VLINFENLFNRTGFHQWRGDALLYGENNTL
jgi:hypothetical protein